MYLKTLELHSAKEFTLSCWMVRNSCKTEAVPLPPRDGVCPLSGLHTGLSLPVRTRCDWKSSSKCMSH